MSLRARLLLGMAVVGVVLVATSLSILRATEHNLVRQVDQQLARSTPEARAGDRRPGFDDDDDGGYVPPVTGQRLPPSALFVARIDPSTGALTTIYVPTTTDGEASAPDLTADAVEAHVGRGAFTVDATEGDLRYRTLVRTQGPNDQVIVLALPLSNVDETLDRLLTILALSAAVILGVLALVTFWVLRLGVRPVKQMTDTAKAIGEGDLSQRIPDAVPGTEAGELGLALNQMLGRIEDAFDERTRSEARLRQFVADASHELRTPVTTIRGYAELYRIGGLAGQSELDEAMRRTEQEAARMGQLVADLLDLARLDQGRPLHLAPVDLAQLIADGAADLRAVEPDRPVTTEADGPVIAVADEPLLRQIIANLTTNARVHTPAGTPITLRARIDGDAAVLEVADEGPGMAPEVAERAFERFYRADPARARQTGGSGLGLAIVAGTVAAHGGQITVDTAPGLGTCVRIALPTFPATSMAAPSQLTGAFGSITASTPPLHSKKDP